MIKPKRKIFKVSDLNPAEYNPRKISDKAKTGLKNSLEKFGYIQDIIVNTKNGANTIIGGHQRLIAMELQPGDDIECTIVSVNKKEEKALNVALNSRHISGEFDEIKLEEIMEEIQDIDCFDDLNLDDIMAEFDFNFDNEEPDNSKEDILPPEPEHVVIKKGDLIELGSHRLLCGDSTDKKQVESLMGGEKADMVFTDPPYGVNIVDQKTNKIGSDNLAKNKKYSKVIGDDSTDTAKNFYNTCCAAGIDKFILWGGNYFVDFLPFSDGWIIWDKRVDMPGNNFADAEMAWCSFHTPVRVFHHLWSGMIQEGRREERVHPNQKPVKMISSVLEKFTLSGEGILDGFLGSGSTLIACEKTNRKCYGMELDEKYCQVITQRWCDYTETDEIKINGKKVSWSKYKEK